MKCVAAVVFLLTVIWALPAFAGTTGVLDGRVIDVRGLPVANVTVYVSSPCQAEKTTTDASGHFVFVDLPPDTYTVTLVRANYLPKQITGVSVEADQTHTVTAMLMWEMRGPKRLLVRSGTVSVHFDRPSLVQPGVASDVYALFFGTLDDASVPARTMPDALRFVPGVMAGPGQPVQYR